MKREAYLLLIVFMLCGNIIYAQQKKRITIAEILSIALDKSYRINEQKLNLENSVQVKREALSSGLPQLKGYVDYKNYIDKPTILLPGMLTGDPSAPDIMTSFSKKHNLDYGIEASQLLFSLEYIYGVKTADKGSELVDLGLELTEMDLVHQVYLEYYNLLAIYKNLEIIRNNMNSLMQVRDKTDALCKADLALSTDLDRIDINISNLKANERQVDNAIAIQTNNLKLISGIDQNIKWVVDTTGVSEMFSKILPSHNRIDSVNFNNRLELQMLDKQIELNDLQIKSAKGALAPNIGAYATYFKQYFKDELKPFKSGDDWFRASLIGVKMNIPIFSGFKSRAKIAQAKIEKEITKNKREEALHGLAIERMNVLNNYTVNLDNCANQQKSIELAEKVRRQEELKYKEGLSSLTDLLVSESELRSAEINYVKYVLQVRISELDLLKSEGKLSQLKNNL